MIHQTNQWKSYMVKCQCNDYQSSSRSSVASDMSQILHFLYKCNLHFPPFKRPDALSFRIRQLQRWWAGCIDWRRWLVKCQLVWLTTKIERHIQIAIITSHVTGTGPIINQYSLTLDQSSPSINSTNSSSFLQLPDEGKFNKFGSLNETKQNKSVKGPTACSNCSFLPLF